MKSQFIAGAIVALLAAGVPAMAQGIEFGPGGVRIDRGDEDGRYRDRSDAVSRGEAVRIAREEGLRDVDDVSRRGWRWIVDGSDRRGRDIRVTVDARSGNVLDVERF
jgi:uncharacterized membrane protein YkoI